MKALLALLALLLLPAAALSEPVAFAKFSPVTTFADALLAADAQRTGIEFAAALPVLGAGDDSVEVEIAGTGRRWIRRADLYLTDHPGYVVGGSGFRVRERPTLRFWRSLAIVTEFLARGEVSEVGADFEEVMIERTTFPLRLPIIGDDVADVLGGRSVRLAGVMMPIRKEMVAALDNAKGAAGATWDIQFVVDVSGDAREFSSLTLKQIGRDLETALRADRNERRVTVTVFGQDVVPKTLRGLGIESLRSDFWYNTRAATDGREPLLDTLRHLQADLRPLGKDDAGRLIVVLSGSDLLERSADSTATLTQPKLDFGPNVSMVIAGVTPEPGDGLTTLQQALSRSMPATLDLFGDNLARRVGSSILNVLKPDADRRLEDAELQAICGPMINAGEICMLPAGLSTGSDLPQPTRPAEGADWYTTTVWLVIDGLVLTRDPVRP